MMQIGSVVLALELVAPRGDEVTIRVRVIDEAGRACAGIPVSLVATHVPPDWVKPGFFDHLDHYLKTAPSDDAGAMAFAHAEELLRPAKDVAYVVRLAIPQHERRQTLIPITPLASVELTLVKPPTGSVILSAPGCEGDTVRLRAVSDDGMGAIFNRSDPCRAVVKQGRVVFPAVEVGTRLAYEVDLGATRGPAPSGKLAGPTVPGQVVHATVPWESAVPVLVGRLIDEDQNPLVDMPLQFHLPANSAVLTTDGNGRFALPVFDDPEDKVSVLEVSSDYHDPVSQSAVGDASAARVLPRKLPPGPHDLGDLVLELPGSARALEALDDAALERAYQERRELRYSNGRFGQLVETCLLEMARRGGEHWLRFLAAELTRVRAADRDIEHRRVNEADPFEYFVALRRAERAPDPLAITLDTVESVLAAQFPDSPVVCCALKNVDHKGESFEVTEGGSYRSGRFERVRVEAVGPDGQPCALLPSPRGMGGGMSMSHTLAPGESLPFAIALASYVSFDAPGAYRVRLHYHDHEDIASESAWRRMILASSPWFTVQIRVAPTRLSRAQIERIKIWVRAIDVTQPVPIIDDTWHPELEFEGAPTSPEDHLFRLGRTAAPVLIEELDWVAEPERRAWILGLLYDLTGRLPPTAGDYHGAVASHRWLSAWPTAKGYAGEFGHGSGKPWIKQQEKLIARWRALRASFPIEIVD